MIQMPRPTLYIDIDDTILAQCFPLFGFDLRPGVISQIGILSKLFDTYWLTHWDDLRVREFLNSIHATTQVCYHVGYCKWQGLSHESKAPAVVEGPPDFYWLEDQHSTGSLKALVDNGKLDRYIQVDPKGLWGFTRALRVLFDKAGIKSKDIERVGGKPSMFNEPLGLHFDWTYVE